ncbi:MAG: hypothetical protein Q8Q01_05600 [archaeon]|nr:hypothetical protein [archaeon]
MTDEITQRDLEEFVRSMLIRPDHHLISREMGHRWHRKLPSLDYYDNRRCFSFYEGRFGKFERY